MTFIEDVKPDFGNKSVCVMSGVVSRCKALSMLLQFCLI